MKDLITKVEELKDKFKSHYALEENAYGRACDDVTELLQNLQQPPCTASLELLKQMLNDEYTAYNNNIDNYMKSSEHDYNVETIRNVIKLIEERQPMT